MRAPPLRIACLVAIVLLPSQAFAQLNADQMRWYGGRYAVDCASPSSPHVDVTADALNVEEGRRRMSGGALQASVAYFGNSEPPRGFIVALLAELPGGLDLTGMLWTDRDGPYLQLDGPPKVRAALGTLVNARFHDCDAPRARLVVARQATDDVATKRDAALRRRNANAPFGTTYRRALGPLARQGWLAELAGYPESLDRTVQVAGKPYRFGQGCKPHDCYDNNMVMLYSPEDGTVHGKAVVASHPSYFGAPPPVVQRELDRLWAGEFRQQR
jgi:hypothetical protein